MELPDSQEGICPLDDDKIVLMCLTLAEMIGGKLYEYQREIAVPLFRFVLNNAGETPTILCARQSGKSQVVSCVCVALMVLMPILSQTYPEDERFNLIDEETGIKLGYDKGFCIGVFGPKKEQADIIYNRVKDFLSLGNGAEVLKSFHLKFTMSNGKVCALSNGSRVRANTANEGATIEGDSYHFIITDETQDIADKMIEKSIMPMGASTNATAAHIGTASYGKCYLYRTQRENMRNYAAGGRKAHFQVNWDRAAEENKFYRKHVMKRKIKLGDRSDTFRMSYCNEWILERGQFVTSTLYESLKTKRKLGDFYAATHLPRIGKLMCVAGIDFAKQKDRTVLSIGVTDFDNPVFDKEIFDEEEWRPITYYGCDLVELCAWEGDDYETQYKEIMERLFMLPYPLARIAVDATGCGSSINDRLRADFSNSETEILSITFSRKTKDDMYRQLSRAMREKHLTLPEDGDTEEQERHLQRHKQEFEDLEKTYAEGYMVVRHPDEPGAHDDYPDSSALMNLCVSSPYGGGGIDLEEFNPFMVRSR